MTEMNNIASIYYNLKDIKDRHTNEVLSIDGVHGIGIDTHLNCLVVYVHKPIDEIASLLPTEIEGKHIRFEKEEKPELGFMYPSYRDTYIGWYSYGRNEAASNGSVGTFGSWWWSRKLKSPVVLSNNHVAVDTNDGAKREWTPAFPFTYVEGGSDFTGAGLDDLTAIRWDRFKNTTQHHHPIITSVTPSSAQAGQVVTIQGINLGYRKGLSRVFFGDKEAKVKSWEEKIWDRDNPLFKSMYGHSQTSSKGYLRMYQQDNSGGASSPYTIVDHQATKVVTSHSDHYAHYDVTVEVYVPEGAGSEIVIQREGNPMHWYNYWFEPNGTGGTVQKYSYSEKPFAELVDFIPIGNVRPVNNPSNLGNDDLFTDATYGSSPVSGYADVSISEATEPMWVNPDVMLKSNFPTIPFPYDHVAFGGKDRFRPAGIFTDVPFTNMVVKKTGSRTGTTFGYVTNPSLNMSIYYTATDGTQMSRLVLDCVRYDGTRVSNSGDSGSSVFTATVAEYNAWWENWFANGGDNLGYQNVTPTATPLEATPNMLIGNFFGYPTAANYGVCDKAKNWMHVWDICTLTEANFIGYAETDNTSLLTGSIEIVVPPVSFYGTIESTSSVEGNIKVLTVTHIPSVDLTAFVASEPTNLTLFGDHYELLGSVESQSSIEGQLYSPLGVLVLSGQIDSVSSVSGTITIILPLEILSLEGTITVQSDVTGTIFVITVGDYTKIFEIAFDLQTVLPEMKFDLVQNKELDFEINRAQPLVFNL